MQFGILKKQVGFSPINFEKSKMCFDNAVRACLGDSIIAHKEKANKLAKKGKRETISFNSLNPLRFAHFVRPTRLRVTHPIMIKSYYLSIGCGRSLLGRRRAQRDRGSGVRSKHPALSLTAIS